MSVNIQGLRTELETEGTIIFCDISSTDIFLVVIENVTCDKSILDEITERYLSNDYQGKTNSTLRNSVYKCDYTI
jgi:hypothetical protein